MKLSVIIPLQNEESTLASLLEEIVKLKPYEIVAVINGSTDRTREIAEKYHCSIIYFEEALGVDVGRAVGASKAAGDMFLFLDGDIVIPSEQLLPFVQAIGDGHDIALNDLSWTLKRNTRPHYTAVAKYALNLFLKREELNILSLIAIPHAMKKTAAQRIGYWNLADPAKAHAIAILNGMSIVAPASIDVIAANKFRPARHTSSEGSAFPPSTSYIIGNHLKAISHVIQAAGRRGGLTDAARNRSILKRFKWLPYRMLKKVKYSAIIPLGEESDSMIGIVAEIINEVKKAGVEEIIAVANGANQNMVSAARQAGAKVIEFPKRLGHNIPRAIGAMYSTGEILLFVDADIILKAEDLRPFLTAVENGADVALNDLECLLDQVYPLHSVSAAKYFLNMVVKRPDLTINSMTAIPHAIHRKVAEKIGFESLMLPPLAQILAILNGFHVMPVQFVDVITTNLIRKENVSKTVAGKLALTTERILGDHVEALAYLLRETDECGGFPEGKRDYSQLRKLTDEYGNEGSGSRSGLLKKWFGNIKRHNN